MNKQTITAVVISLVIGFLAGGLFYDGGDVAGNGGTHRMPDGTMMHNEMSNMMAGLSGKTGDEFDKAFLIEMIMHHEGAVDMAETALIDAKHAEIKTMAEAIISAQTTEIAQMKAWLKAWYGIER
jgi:uncharacterized protein (DUF305 family)